MFPSISLPYRRGLSLLVGAVLFVVGALVQASPAQAYSLTLNIADNLGHSATVPTGPFSGAGANTFVDAGVLFPEFSSFVISVTAGQSAAHAFLNEVGISGTVTAAAGPPINMTLSVLGSGFTTPHPLVDATQALASSSLPGAFASASLTGTLNGMTVATESLTTLPGAAGPMSHPGIFVDTTYDADLVQTITGIARSTDSHLNNWNLTSNMTWTTVPEPSSVILLGTSLGGLLGGIGISHARKRTKGAQ